MQSSDRLLVAGLGIVFALLLSAAIRGARTLEAPIVDVSVLGVPEGRLERGPAFEPSLRLRPRPVDEVSSPVELPSPTVVRSLDLGARIRSLVALADGGLAAVTDEPALVRVDGSLRIVSRTHLPAPSVVTPIEDEGRTLIGTDAGEILAIDPSGTIVARARPSGGGPIETMVRDVDSLLLVAVHRLIRVDRSFAVLDSHELGARAVAPPAIALDGSIAIGTQAEQLILLDRSLERRFSYQGFADFDSSPTFTDDGRVVGGSLDGRVVAIRGDGTIDSLVDVGCPIRAPLLVHEGLVFVATMGPRPRVLGLDDRARLRFVFRGGFTDDEEDGFGSAIRFVDRSMLVGGVDDALHVVDRSGHERASLRARGDVDVPAIVLADGRIVFGAEDGILRLVR